MRILIVEDENPIAHYLGDLCGKVLSERAPQIAFAESLDAAEDYLRNHEIDLCLLDLNLNGESGFDLLKTTLSNAFHTIVITANEEEAVQAFEYGVLDFIPKPFDEERLEKAFQRYFERSENREVVTRFLTVRKDQQNIVLPVSQIRYFKAAGIYVEAHLRNGRIEILDKTMDRLQQILPARFVRIHRSFLVDIAEIAAYRHVGGGSYQVRLHGGDQLPLSRQKYRDLHEILNYN